MTGVLGIHHVTAIASDPQRNLDFYVGLLGLRLVKRTVNFDDPETYHLYFGDEVGNPGSIMTFFPWPGARPGRQGTGQVAVTSLDRKSTRLNSSHGYISYAVFCLKKKKKKVSIDQQSTYQRVNVRELLL